MVVWDLRHSRTLRIWRWEGASGRPNAALSPDGRWLVMANRERLTVWDIDLTDPKGKEQSLPASCNLQDGTCIRNLCEKISSQVNEQMLLRLLGEELLGDVDASLMRAPCPVE
jgi:hypothetical protein